MTGSRRILGALMGALPLALSGQSPACAGGLTAMSCIALVATPDLPNAGGSVALVAPHSPFGIAVTRDGRPRYETIVAIHGLPRPESLGAYTAYVAWATTVNLDSTIRLGTVRNGVVRLGEVSFDQFRVFVSAERSPNVRTRAGRLVLRGTSPSARLLAHRDLRIAGIASRDSSGEHAHGTWPMPPMAPMLAPMPGMHSLRPSAAPFLPGRGVDPGTLPLRRPSAPVSLTDGDTLALSAGLVRRAVGGRTFTMYAFNGQSPGPLIRVTEGATIVVRFTNRLDMPTSVHWHGVRLENRFDGVPDLTQPPIAPGDSFTYRVHFRDAGIFWYHPHVREDVQLDLGLAGNMLVRPRRDELAPVDHEEVLMLDDLAVGDNGLLPFGESAATHALMGRFGNVFLVNGEPAWNTTVSRGDVVRLSLTNASNARIFNVSIDGATMKLVGSDVGLLEREEWVSSVVLAPAERYIVDVRFDRPGRAVFVNRVRALDHMLGTFSAEVDTLGVVVVQPGRRVPSKAAGFNRLRTHTRVVAELAPFRAQVNRPVDRELVVKLRTHDLLPLAAAMLTGISIPIDWNDGMPMVNWATTTREIEWILRDPATGLENMAIDWRFKVGDTAKIRIVNDPDAAHAMDHPIHLHGQRFLVLSRDGRRSTNLVWKDTVVIPSGETVELLVDMSNPGRWMMHCHIAEHLGAGMMMVVTVDL
jgi:suppressor of ftsI